MQSDLVSIIIPTYNRRYVIKDAIDSCLSQSYQNIEVIICDDHSTDGTKEYIEERMKEDSRIRYCVTPEGRKGANAARNAAIKIAKGKFMAFLDSDDYLLVDSIEVRMNAFKENPKMAMIYGNVYCECNGKRTKWVYCNLRKNKLSQKKFLMENLALCCQISIMFRSDVFKYIDMLNEEQKSWTDDGFVVALGMKFPIMHCGKFVGVIRKSEVSLTSNKWNMYSGCKMMVDRYKKDIIKYASFKRYIIWKIRLLSAYCYAKEVDCEKKFLKQFWRTLHEKTRDAIRPFFKVYCE